MEQAEREWAEPPDDDPTVPCPQCGFEHPDADGLPVLYCLECGYCCHPNITDGVCGFCSRKVRIVKLGGGLIRKELEDD